MSNPISNALALDPTAKGLRQLAGVLASFFLFACFGCYPVPVRFPTRATDSATNSIDLRFLKVGSTTRADVAAKLASLTIHSGQENFFWGRPRVSKYREIIMVGYVPIGPGDRMWGVQNLLITYDGRGLVKTWTLAGDKELLKQIDLLDNALGSPLDLTSPLLLDSVAYRIHEKHVPDARRYEQIKLGPDWVECFDVKIARSEIRAIALTNSGETDSLAVTMFFRHPIDFSKTDVQSTTDRLRLYMNGRDLLVLHRYLKQSDR